MKDIYQILRSRRPNDSAPFTHAQMMERRKQGTALFNAQIEKERSMKIHQSVLGRSGVDGLYLNCTIENYEAEREGQGNARRFAHQYAAEFDNNNGKGFVFSGGTGTGKNHLSAGICNQIMESGRTCLIATVTELMINMRSCYEKDSKVSENQFIKALCSFDFLVIDEIGVQRNSIAEMITLNQVVDTRTKNLKSTAMLTNLTKLEFNQLMGERIVSRMKMNSSEWLTFDWGDYRVEAK